jgi:threonylcarbamoyladenosine tRNA methylthiotransferase MtaB
VSIIWAALYLCAMLVKTAAYYTLGCKLNFAETSTIARQLTEAGVERTEFNEGADIYVINTCSVTDHADRKCRKVVAEALRFNPDAKVVIVGCYAQLKPQEIAEIPGVSMVLGAREKFELPSLLEDLQSQVSKPKILRSRIKETTYFLPSFSLGDRTRTFLKVQDGCDYFCSFCTIPLARGRSRNASIPELVKQAESIAASGIQEVVLSGVNIGDFGKTTGETFIDLIRALDKVNGISRYRISSIEPNLLDSEIISFVASSDKFLPHFHIPLQSGSNEILESMRRRYKRELYAERVAEIKSLMPDACIGVDVIVGFPGETEAHFQETYTFLQELDVDYLHVFTYSERPNTTALRKEGKVPGHIRKKRTGMLRILSEKKRERFYRSQIGKTSEVLWEADAAGGEMQGYTRNYVKIVQPYDPADVNEVRGVRLTSVRAEDGLVTVQPVVNSDILPESLKARLA